MVRLDLPLHASSEVTKAAAARLLVHFRLVYMNLTSERSRFHFNIVALGIFCRGQDEASQVSCMVLLLHSTFIPRAAAAGLPRRLPANFLNSPATSLLFSVDFHLSPRSLVHFRVVLQSVSVSRICLSSTFPPIHVYVHVLLPAFSTCFILFYFVLALCHCIFTQACSVPKEIRKYILASAEQQD